MPIKLFAIVIIFLGAIFIMSSCLRNHKSDGTSELPEKVSYNFNIRPILSDKCYKCHGPDASHREAQLRLDISDSPYSLLKVTKGAHAIVPGLPEQSERIRDFPGPVSQRRLSG